MRRVVPCSLYNRLRIGVLEFVSQSIVPLRREAFHYWPGLVRAERPVTKLP